VSHLFGMGQVGPIGQVGLIGQVGQFDNTVQEMLGIMAIRERGEVPDHYTATTTCKHCGPVSIWAGCPPAVLGCPWCFNRMKGLPIPTVAGRNR
jgi:hypothetical protein